MAQLKGSGLCFVVVLLFVTVQWKTARAVTYNVGDATGWSFDVEGWPEGKSFKAGDVLQFKYAPGSHNVVEFQERSGYDSCEAPANAKVHETGNDQIQLEKGDSFFICTFPGHCNGGVRIAVTAS